MSIIIAATRELLTEEARRQIAAFPGVRAVLPSDIYSLQVDLISPTIEDGDILILWKMGVRYENVRAFLTTHHITVCKYVYSLQDLLNLLTLIEKKQNTSLQED